jgi:hypothetical protein
VARGDVTGRAVWRGLQGALAAAVVLVGAAQAEAQCITPDVLDQGVAYTLADGEVGSVKRIEGGAIQINYRTADRTTSGRDVLRLGLYPVETSYSSAPADVIGVWSGLEVEIGYTGRFPEPRPGRAWETNLRFTSVSNDHSGVPRTNRDRATATYRFLEAQQVELSGCSYRMIPVEATILYDSRSEIVRTAYFPDLGYGIVTQVTNLGTGAVSSNGIAAMRPAG